jgi:Mg2+/Co2+ transporter CorB
MAGFILHRTGRIPPQGTSLEQGPVTLTVHRRTAQMIQKVRIRWAES